MLYGFYHSAAAADAIIMYIMLNDIHTKHPIVHMFMYSVFFYLYHAVAMGQEPTCPIPRKIFYLFIYLLRH